MRPAAVGVACVLAATACWGTGTVLSKQALDRGLAPLALLCVELAASTALLAAFVLARGRRAGEAAPPPDRRLVALGLLNPGLAYLLGLLGLVTISASLSVLLWATEPVLILLLAVVWLGERLAPVTAVATAVAVAGAVLVVYRPGASGDVRGIVLSVAAVAACACYTVLTRRLLLDDGTFEVVLSQQAAALGLALVALAGTAAAGALAGGASASAWAFAVASGVVYYGLAFTAYVAGLRRLPAEVAGSLLPAIPVFGLAAAYLAGDRLGGVQWLGVALVVAGTATAAGWHLRRSPGLGWAPTHTTSLGENG